ncbi:MAG: response regulator [Clostridiales bacterium]|nr:response regulator [Clostridiales bacterium]
MGGGIEVESEPGKGSTFSLLMEFQPGTKPEDKPASAASGAMTENPADKSFEAEEVVRRLRILVAEDEPINRLVISKMLIEKGYQVVSVENGMEAVEQFAGGSFDIVLMDIQMPLMNGIEATKRIRELEGNSSHIPIVAITAFALLGDREKFLSAGMDEYLTKPTKMSDLIATIERMTADGKASGGMPERVSINEKGEVVFVSCDHEPFEKRSISIKHAAEKHLCDMGCQLGKLNQAMEKLDLEKMGQIAHKIKGICSDMEADDMKYNAFNIELAARRGNLEDACINVRLLESLFNTFKEPMSNEAGN